MSSAKKQTLRLRVFAGPNGSGKSTILHAVRSHEVKGVPVDFGIYVNADDIAQSLKNKGLPLKKFRVPFQEDLFRETAHASGLVNDSFTEHDFHNAYRYQNNRVIATHTDSIDRLAQILADFLRKQLLKYKKKFSFETVFSHPSKLDIMREAAEAGYKVYLYFVSTESPEINKYRVKARIALGGHSVPEDRIESRYYRSLDLLYEAAQIAYQAYFFDNSMDGEQFRLFQHFKLVQGKKNWDEADPKKIPDWFFRYYYEKQPKT